ncbi:NUDIX hydrolase [Haliea salexigens]|uniref:NUDIX hydrolase n=1 Tax=Haliea salexigens TaxID=287487 RepID=UPI000404E282|nr:NUDIX hydrolase [Haliea salexigens]
MSEWFAHVTVATVVFNEGRYLMVEERDKTSGRRVFNQPAGHLEAGETLFQAALRETREETGWSVELQGVLGLARYVAAGNGVTYYRTTFCAQPRELLTGAELDPDILAVHWLDYEEILASSARMRSPLVLAAIEQHRSGIRYPLDLISPA